MKARRHPAKGPLLTFALMLGSIAAVNAVDRYLEAHRKPAQPTISASAASADSARAATHQ